MLRHTLLAPLAALLLCQPAVALPYQDGVVTVGDREFYVGPRESGNRILQKQYSDDQWSFWFAMMPWLDEFVRADPVLYDQRIEFNRSSYSAHQKAGEIPSLIRDSAVIQTDPALQVDGLTTWRTTSELLFFPVDSTLTYGADCPWSPQRPDFSLCVVTVAYPYGTNTLLIAKEFFPGPLEEYGPRIDAIARRMVEIAICLDVTDIPPAERETHIAGLRDDNPRLEGCHIDLTS